MKKHVFTLFFAVFSLSIFAQQLSNNGFETWSQASNPNGWSTFASGVVGTPYAAGASFLQPAAVQQSPGMVGGSSIKLTTIDVSTTLGTMVPGLNTVPGAVGLGALNSNALSTGNIPFLGTAFPYRPDTMFFAYTYFPTHADSTAKLELFFLRAGNVVAQGYYYLLDSNSTPGLRYIPINDWVDACPADTIILNFMSSSSLHAGNVGSRLYVDSVFFRYTNTPTLPTVTIAASQSTVTESVGTVTYTATLSAPNPCGAISIPVSYSGTATGGTDYSTSGTSFNFPIGATTATVTVTITDDTNVEPSETIIATLGSSTGATLGNPSSATITITDNDVPTISLSASPLSIPENNGPSTFTATLSQVAYSTVSFGINFTGTATPADYNIPPTLPTIPAGSLSTTFSITAVSDVLIEGNETIIATLVNPVNATLGSPVTTTVTIVDDDVPPSVSVSVSPSSVTEGGTSTITATLSNPAPANVIVNLSYSGSAVSGTDYTAPSTTINIPANSTTGSITVSTIGNLIIDGNRTIIATINSVSPNATIGTPVDATITIIDDDTPPNVSISASPASISENGGVSTVTATLSHSYSSDITVTIAYSGTAVDGTDYTANTTITIPAGSTTGSVTVNTIDNTVIDGNKTVIATLTSASSGVTIVSPSNTTITITDDDIPEVSISVDSTQILETGGSAIVTITMSRPNPMYPVTANLIYGGSATYNVDYTAPGSIIIPAGSTSTTFTLSSTVDALVEGNESVAITISNASNGTIIGSPSMVIVTILDDDTAVGTPYLSITPSAYSVTEGATVTLTASLSVPSPTDVTANIGFTGTAVIPNDYSANTTAVTIPAGSLTATVVLSTVDDIYYEGTRIIFASLTEVSGAFLGQPATASVSILDNENSTAPPPPPPVLPIDSATSGISDVNVLDAIKVYPVPAQDFIKVSMSIDVPQIATLVDMQGRIIKEFVIASGENTLDLSTLNSGNYIVRFTNEQYNYFTGAKPITVVK